MGYVDEDNITVHFKYHIYAWKSTKYLFDLGLMGAARLAWFFVLILFSKVNDSISKLYS